MMTRLVIIADPRDVATRILVPELLRLIREHPGCRCLGMVMTSCEDSWDGHRHYWRKRFSRRLQAILGSGYAEAAMSVRPLALEALARTYSIPLLLAPEGDPNHAEVLHRLRTDLLADGVINVYCRTRFREPLLSSFEMSVNYHNGLLPRFRGLRASNWSIYMEEPTSGYTFHRMDSGMDTGAILTEGAVPVLAGDTPAGLELRKAKAACLALPQVLDALDRRDAGHPQTGIGGHHNRQTYLMATRVEDPTALTQAEWFRRLRAFLSIKTNVAGRWMQVTGLSPVDGPRRLAFRTADGGWLRVSGIGFWPSWLLPHFLDRQ